MTRKWRAQVQSQLLGLQEGWTDFGVQSRWSILELLLNSLSAEVLRRHASQIAATYAAIIGEEQAPQSLHVLRIGLRKKQSRKEMTISAK